MSQQTSIADLAAKISARAADLRDVTPSGASFNFGVSPDAVGSDELRKQHESARAEMLGAARQLTALLQTPTELIRDVGARVNDAMALQFITDFDVAKKVPIDGEIAFAKLAVECQVNEVDLKRVLRYGMTSGFFHEPHLDYIAHTAATKALIEDRILRDNLAIMVDEMFPAASMTSRAMKQHPLSQKPVHSVQLLDIFAWNLANAASEPFFNTLSSLYPERLEVLVRGMHTSASTINARILAQNLDWSTYPPSPLVVDVGGGPGVVSIALAREHDKLRCIVQDLPYAVASGKDSLPPEFVGRISFAPHDVFAEQPVHGADMYLLRAVFRNWPDEQCVQIAKALVPALKKGARVVINDPVMPDPGAKMPIEFQRAVRGFDLSMMTFFHGRDRTAAETAQVFAKADARFRVLGTRIPTINVGDIPRPALLGVTEVVWEGP